MGLTNEIAMEIILYPILGPILGVSLYWSATYTQINMVHVAVVVTCCSWGSLSDCSQIWLQY